MSVRIGFKKEFYLLICWFFIAPLYFIELNRLTEKERLYTHVVGDEACKEGIRRTPGFFLETINSKGR